MGSVDLVIRPATEREHALVRDSWVRTFEPEQHKGWGGDPYIQIGPWRAGHLMAPRAWFGAHRAAVNHYLATATIMVVALATMPDEALGWVCYETSRRGVVTLHYCYVLRDARRRGIGRALLQHAINNAEKVRLSHSTPDGIALLDAVRSEAETAA